MRGPICIFWANLTPFSLQELQLVGASSGSRSAGGLAFMKSGAVPAAGGMKQAET